MKILLPSTPRPGGIEILPTQGQTPVICHRTADFVQGSQILVKGPVIPISFMKLQIRGHPEIFAESRADRTK
jgi:hypothetical protein